jgi:hypothetical protein
MINLENKQLALHCLWYLVSHILFCEGPKQDAHRSQTVMSANCHYHSICQHKVMYKKFYIMTFIVAHRDTLDDSLAI